MTSPCVGILAQKLLAPAMCPLSRENKKLVSRHLIPACTITATPLILSRLSSQRNSRCNVEAIALCAGLSCLRTSGRQKSEQGGHY